MFLVQTSITKYERRDSTVIADKRIILSAVHSYFPWYRDSLIEQISVPAIKSGLRYCPSIQGCFRIPATEHLRSVLTPAYFNPWVCWGSAADLYLSLLEPQVKVLNQDNSWFMHSDGMDLSFFPSYPWSK